MNRRTERVNDLLREQLDYLLRREAKDPRLGTIWSITGVEVTRDLRHAKVFVSVLGDDAEVKSTMAAFTAARGYLRRELGHRLNTMHHIPAIVFERDTSIEYGARLSAIMDDLAREREERGMSDPPAPEADAGSYVESDFQPHDRPTPPAPPSDAAQPEGARD